MMSERLLWLPREYRLVTMLPDRGNPRVRRGAGVLRGTRMPVNAIVDNFDYAVTVAEISEQFEVSQDRIEAILALRQESSRCILIRTFRGALLAPQTTLMQSPWHYTPDTR